MRYPCDCGCRRTGVAPSRRYFIAGCAASAVVPAAALAQAAAPASSEDVQFMRMALDEARQADFPFGAVIVRDGAVIARAQPRTHQRRSHRPRRDDRDPALPRRPRQCGVARQHALHVGRVLRDVHGRDPVVSRRAAGFRRVDRPARHQDQSDHDYGCRDRGEGFLRADLDHRRRAGGRGHGAVREVTRVWVSCRTGEMSMLAIRAAKAATMASVALFDSLVSFSNLTDYGTNLVFVEHVMSMDAVFATSTVKYRAITSPVLQHAAYGLIIATELSAAVLCWIGAALLARRLRADAAAFHRAKSFAVVGLTLGVMLWQVVFMSIAGEWFAMWQSQQWNSVQSASRFLLMAIAVLIFVAMPDQELDGRRAT